MCLIIGNKYYKGNYLWPHKSLIDFSHSLNIVVIPALRIMSLTANQMYSFLEY